MDAIAARTARLLAAGSAYTASIVEPAGSTQSSASGVNDRGMIAGNSSVGPFRSSGGTTGGVARLLAATLAAPDGSPVIPSADVLNTAGATAGTAWTTPPRTEFFLGPVLWSSPSSNPIFLSGSNSWVNDSRAGGLADSGRVMVTTSSPSMDLVSTYYNGAETPLAGPFRGFVGADMSRAGVMVGRGIGAMQPAPVFGVDLGWVSASNRAWPLPSLGAPKSGDGAAGISGDATRIVGLSGGRPVQWNASRAVSALTGATATMRPVDVNAADVVVGVDSDRGVVWAAGVQRALDGVTTGLPAGGHITSVSEINAAGQIAATVSVDRTDGSTRTYAAVLSPR